MRRIFVDTEWSALPWSGRAELMWVGLADESGRSWSAISSEVEIDPTKNDFIAGVWTCISPDDPRSSLEEIAAGVRSFCGDVDEFWAWVPPFERVVEAYDLGDAAASIYAEYWDWDLQVLRSLIDPWPPGWPTRLCNLQAAVDAAGIEVPARQPNHLAPDVHPLWNLEVFRRIERTRGT